MRDTDARREAVIEVFTRQFWQRDRAEQLADEVLAAADAVSAPVVERLSALLENVVEAFYMVGTPVSDELPEAIAEASAALAESSQRQVGK